MPSSGGSLVITVKAQAVKNFLHRPHDVILLPAKILAQQKFNM
jgi:hypothetical protein